jgi:Tol biopolymer transport system component
MGRRGIVTCAVLFACVCAPADAQLVYSGDDRLYEINADGSARQPFTTPTAPRAVDSEPAWSPDGTQLAVVHARGDSDDLGSATRIDLLAADGSTRRRLTRLERRESVTSPAWSPDGSRLAFVRYTQRSGRLRSAIVVHELAGGKRVLVSQRLDRRLTSVALPEWSPDGQSVLYSAFRLGRSFNFRSSIQAIAVDGGSAALIARNAHSPAFSPDGSRIAFISIADRNGRTCGSDECFYNGELYVMRADGGDPRRLTRSEGDDEAPDWSADGGRIAFNSNRNYPNGTGHEIYSIEPDGTCLTWLTNGTANSVEPTWRPTAGAGDSSSCGATPRPPLVATDLAPAQAFGGAPPLWLGRTHRGLLLSDVDMRRSEPLFFGYLDCAHYRPRDCPPGIQVLVQSVCARDAHAGFLGTNYEPITRRRGALVADYGTEGGLTAYAGGLEVHIVSESFRKGLVPADFRALRPFPRETTVDRFRPPAIPASLANQVRRVARVHRRLGSIAATADRVGISRMIVRRRLRNAAALRQFGHRVRTTDC